MDKTEQACLAVGWCVAGMHVSLNVTYSTEHKRTKHMLYVTVFYQQPREPPCALRSMPVQEEFYKHSGEYLNLQRDEYTS